MKGIITKSKIKPVLRSLDRYLKSVLYFFFPHLDPVVPVDRLIRSIPEVILNESVTKHVKVMRQIRNACIEKYVFTSDLPPSFRSEMYFATRHVYHMSNVIINVRNGVCFTESIGFLESLGSLRSWILSRPVRKKKSFDFSESYPITCINTTGYAHFIMEELPRLIWVLKEFPDLRLVCPVNLPVFASSAYHELRKKNVLRYDPIKIKEEFILVNDFVFTQAEAYSGFWNKLDIICLRDSFLPDTERSGNDKIYVSRRHSNRSFGNEAVLEEQLINRGFKILFLEELSFLNQIKTFRNADIIITPHGAGLANLVWCSSDTIVIELFTNDVFNDCFARLSSSLSCKHYCLGWDNPAEFRKNIVLKVTELLNNLENLPSEN